MNYRFEIIVRGKVQGVWYRKSSVEKALELGLSGWAKNMADSSLLIEIK